MNQVRASGKIRILYINPTSMMSGAEFSLLSLIENINEDKFTPVLQLPGEGLFAEKARRMGIEVVILPCMMKVGEAHPLSKYPRTAAAVWKTRRIIRSRGIGIVHANSPRSAYVGGPAAKLAGVPCVVHVRDIHFNPFTRPLRSRFLARFPDVIVAVSTATKEAMVGVNPAIGPKVRVVFNGVDPGIIKASSGRNIRKEFGLDESVPLVGSVGLLHPVKGHDVLIRAVQVLHRSSIPVNLVIAGGALGDKDGPYKDELLRLARQLGIGDRVVLTGFREDVLDIMRGVDVMAHPAVYPEPLPRTLLEASALEKPIVATRVGGIPELVTDGVTGLLVEPSSPEELAAAILSLLKDRKRAVALGAEARRNIERNFTLEAHVRAMTGIYEGLLKRDP